MRFKILYYPGPGCLTSVLDDTDACVHAFALLASSYADAYTYAYAYVRGKALMLMSKRSGREIEVWMLVGWRAEPPTADGTTTILLSAILLRGGKLLSAMLLTAITHSAIMLKSGFCTHHGRARASQ